MAKKKKDKAPEGATVVAENRRARHRYVIEEKFEAGLELLGAEVKSLRGGQVSITESYCRVQKNQVYVFGLNVDRYAMSGYVQHDPLRVRRLLLHRSEIKRISIALERKGYALVPLRLYFRNGLAKLEIGLGRGKAAPDKREDLKKADVKRELQRELKAKR